MEIKATVKNLRISPKKVRLVVDLVRGKNAVAATHLLRFTNKKAARPVMKLIKSAIANAENNNSLKADNLFVKEIMVEEGVTLKRFMPRAYGRASAIRKRSSHVRVVLSEIQATEAKASEKKEETVEEPKTEKKATKKTTGKKATGEKKAAKKPAAKKPAAKKATAAKKKPAAKAKKEDKKDSK
jgi:large subunit ribosomal protein L22